MFIILVLQKWVVIRTGRQNANLQRLIKSMQKHNTTLVLTRLLNWRTCESIQNIQKTIRRLKKDKKIIQWNKQLDAKYKRRYKPTKGTNPRPKQRTSKNQLRIPRRRIRIYRKELLEYTYKRHSL